jgi:O-antigen/teichoic acid export membrane protein
MKFSVATIIGWQYWNRLALKITSEHVAVLLGRGIEAVGSLLFLKMLSTLADKSDVGTYMLASSYVAILLTVSFSAFDQGLLRNVTEYRKQSTLATRYSSMLISYLFLSFIVSGVCSVALYMFSIGTALNAVFVPLCFWFMSEAIKNLNVTVANGSRARLLIAGASSVDYGFRLALLWVAYAIGSVTTPAILSVLAAAGLAASTIYLYSQRKLLSWFSWVDASSTLIDSIKFSWPMIFWGIFGWLQNMSNRWMLSWFADMSMVAEYSVLVALGTFPVTILLGLVGTYIVPILYEKESGTAGSSREIVRRLALSLIPIGGLLVLLVTLWHRDFTILLSGENYAAHSHVLPFIMAAACTSAICSVLTYTVYAQRRVASLLLANTVPGAFSLVFGYFAVRYYQFDGAILTLVLSQVIAAVLFVAVFVRSSERVPA